MLLDALATVSGKGNFGLGRRSELEQVRRTMDGYPGIKVRMRQLEAWAAASFGNSWAFSLQREMACLSSQRTRLWLPESF